MSDDEAGHDVPDNDNVEQDDDFYEEQHLDGGSGRDRLPGESDRDREGSPGGDGPSDRAGGQQADKPCTSSYRGVCWHKKSKKWQAAINSSGRHVYLGSFDTEEEAARMFDKVALHVRGSKAKLNFHYKDYIDPVRGCLVMDHKLEQLVQEARAAMLAKMKKKEEAAQAAAAKHGLLSHGSGGAGAVQMPSITTFQQPQQYSLQQEQQAKKRRLELLPQATALLGASGFPQQFGQSFSAQNGAERFEILAPGMVKLERSDHDGAAGPPSPESAPSEASGRHVAGRRVDSPELDRGGGSGGNALLYIPPSGGGRGGGRGAGAGLAGRGRAGSVLRNLTATLGPKGGAGTGRDATAPAAQASKPGGNGSIGNGGLSSVLLAVQRKLPPNASLDSVVPCADDDIMGIVYSINTPADGSDAGGAGGGEERSSSGATIMRSGAGVLYGQNFKDLGVFSTPTDTLNACQGAISLLKDFKDSMQLQQAAAAAAGTAGLPQSLALSAMAARVQQAAHQQQQAAAAAAAVRGGLVGSSSQVVYNPAQGAVQLLPNQQLVLGDLQGSGGAPLQYVLLPSATTTLQLPHNMLGKLDGATLDLSGAGGGALAGLAGHNQRRRSSSGGTQPMPSAATGGAGGMSSSEAALANALRAVGARVSTTSLGGGSPNNSGGVNAGFSTLQNLGRVDIQEALQLYFTTRG